ncbi:tetratricopeptide repeat protein [Agarivorans sp. MS3-6]|uniref:tetratricopeptide repeat protein n=1 Tax=Agarivorans sp. TSD2052 TaxID=2937286 RepID=UPI00200D803F|nr:tetratricopeptide repeat protein [Agarivorans sp. TSD2052]UPW17908.1 sel1 repeat family protein [Agarivorans sp. TSD2052]
MNKQLISFMLVAALTLPVMAESIDSLSVDDELDAEQQAAVPVDPTEYTSPSDIGAVQIYKQAELISWINNNQHLARVKADECQLVEDIGARAEKVAIPAYQFLWGDMLAWGVCVDPNPELGVMYMWRAANQGLAAAMEQLGRYYATGTLVQQDYAKAIPLLREAAGQGFLPAQLRLVALYVEGKGSPYDYEDAYRWLHHSIIADKAVHREASLLLASLAKKMPNYVVDKAKASNQPY